MSRAGSAVPSNKPVKVPSPLAAPGDRTPSRKGSDRPSQVNGSQVSVGRNSQVSAANAPRVPSVVGGASEASSSSQATATTVVRGRILKMEEELTAERKAREEAQKQLEVTMQELELVEKVLKLRNIAQPAST